MTYKFCPKCANELVSKIPEFDHFVRRMCEKCGFVFYSNPVPTTGALIVNDRQEVLLVKRNWHPYQGFLDVPGGFLEPQELPESGACREVREELDVEISIIELTSVECDVYDDGGDIDFNGKGISVITFIYESKIVSGEAKINEEELAGFEWFKIERIPEILEKVAFGSNQKALMKMYNKYCNKK